MEERKGGREKYAQASTLHMYVYIMYIITERKRRGRS